VPDIQGSFRSFGAAVEYFLRKRRVPTATWRDLYQAQHAPAFTVAGALRDDLLADLQGAVQAAIEKGETLEDFRARFDEIVSKRGWTGWTGEETAQGRAWRTQVIYTTNLRVAYQAGRWETLKTFPYLKYQHNAVRQPREEHLQWDGLVLPTDDPWWKTHYPPNGWGCRCSVTGVSEARLRVLGKKGPDTAPGPSSGDPPPEWAYNVGEAAEANRA
jgi:uncharacterized protein with gpF-like domain